jgi:low affinity Fe/Cu permease
MNQQFSRFARWVSKWTGSAIAFGLAVLTIVVWGLTGPIFGFSEVWQLVINTGTTIVTFLMVFLIQHTQNHDTAAIHRKLDEIIVKLPETDSHLAGLEKRLGEEEGNQL